MRNPLIILLLLLPLPAFAVMDKPAEIASYIKAEKPYGDGFYTWTLFTAYEASLWTDQKPWSMDALFALSLKYNMRFSTNAIVDRSIKEMNEIEPLTQKQQADYAAALSPLIPPVQKGDTITALHLPGKGAVFYHNGKRTGEVDDPMLARRFFSIWLSEKTSAPDLRKALLAVN